MSTQKEEVAVMARSITLLIAFLSLVLGRAPQAVAGCDGHNCSTKIEVRTGQGIGLEVTAKAGANAPFILDQYREGERPFIGCVVPGNAVDFSVMAADIDDHVCQGAATQPVTNFIQNTTLSVQITGTGLAATVPLESNQAGNIASRTWNGSWTVPIEAAGQMLDFQFSGSVADKPCTNHPASNDPDVDPDAYRGQFAVIKVDIEQAEANVCWRMPTAAVNLTAGSYWAPEVDGDVDWTSSPVGLSNVVVSEGSTTFSFCPSNSTPGQYEVTATSSLLPDCKDVCTVRVVKPDIVAEGLDDSEEENPPGALFCVTNGPGQTVTRKRITIEKCVPSAWDGDVELLWPPNKVKLYTAPSNGVEVTSGQTFANAALPTNLWVEGIAVSDTAGDGVFRLNPRDVNCPHAATGCDRVVMTVIAINFAVSVDDHPGWGDGILFDNCSNTVAITVTGIDDPSCLAFSFQSYPEQEGQLINKAGTNIDFFQTEALLVWKTSRSYWYGVLPEQCCYTNLFNYIFELTVNSNHNISRRYCINWPAEKPGAVWSVSAKSSTSINEPEPVPGITNLFRCLIEFGDFVKTAVTTNLPSSCQYADEIEKEEIYHVCQFLGQVPSDEGGQGDTFTAKGIKWMINWVGDGPWYTYGSNEEQAYELALEKVAEGDTKERQKSMEIFINDRGFIELKAKAHAEYNAAYTYHCTYEREYGSNPTNHIHPAF
jgi:hypothetical protein